MCVHRSTIIYQPYSLIGAQSGTQINMTSFSICSCTTTHFMSQTPIENYSKLCLFRKKNIDIQGTKYKERTRLPNIK